MKLENILSNKELEFFEQVGMQAGTVGKPAGPGAQQPQQNNQQQPNPQDKAKLRKAKQDQIKAKQQELTALKQELGSIK